MYADVLVKSYTRGKDDVFTYHLPKTLVPKAKIGQLVYVPFRNRKLPGIILDLHKNSPPFPTKSLLSIRNLEPAVNKLQVKLARFISNYYFSSLALTLFSIIPLRGGFKTIPLLKINLRSTELEKILKKIKGPKQKKLLIYLSRQKEAVNKKELQKKLSVSDSTINLLLRAKLIKSIKKIVWRTSSQKQDQFSIHVPKLTPSQNKILSKIRKNWGKTFLLHGVTGSGKTEIYLKAAEERIKKGEGVIVLVPEIALTPQTACRFERRFPGQVVVIHSGLSAGEKFEAWYKIKHGLAKVAVGPRSAIFAPFEKIGLIVIDEEHDGSYKQESHPRYHARTVARYLSQLSGATLILGSATPSIESYYRAKKGKYILINLPQKVHKQKKFPSLSPFSQIFVIDMSQEKRAGNRGIFSEILKSSLKKTLEKKKQAILFLNRRGNSTIIVCQDCGYIATCPNCNQPLVYHALPSKTHPPHTLRCHNCGASIPAPVVCPKCGGSGLRYFGAGTEKVEQEIKHLFPAARTLRLDRDAIKKRGSYFVAYRKLLNKEVDILIGTQMIAKGWDLPDVELVGIVSADPGMFLPDFLNQERMFSLLSQVAGRTSRRQISGKVILQTYNPENPLLKKALQEDYPDFYREEIKIRKELFLPPLSHITRLVCEGSNATRVEEKTKKTAKLISRKVPSAKLSFSACFFSKLRGKYRFQIVITTLKPPYKIPPLREFLTKLGRDSLIDVDPVNML